MAPPEGLDGGAEVRLQALTKTFGPVVAVCDVSVTIDRGSFFTLLGPSGSGKTTTLMMMAGFTYPTSGDVFVDGKPMAGLPPQKRDLGMVFQSYAVFPHLTVYDNVAFPLQIRKRPRLEIVHRVGETLELVRAYYKIRESRVRKRIFEMVKAVGAASHAEVLGGRKGR